MPRSCTPDDRLLEVYNEHRDLDYMHKARETVKKMQNIVNAATTKPRKNTFLYLVSRVFCKHDYHLTNQFEMKSEFDIVVEAGKTPNTHNSQTRRIVTDYKCIKCNNIKRLKTKTPN